MTTTYPERTETYPVRPTGLLAATSLAVASLAACSSPAPIATVGGECPTKIVIQHWWLPQAENAGLLPLLLGPANQPATYTIDGNHNSVSGPLYDQGKATRYTIELRAGGPAVSYKRAPLLLRTDPSILLAQVETADQIAGYAAGIPTRVVFAPLDSDPSAVMWDADKHPEWQAIQDVGATDAPVYALTGSASAAYLVAAGILKASQVTTGEEGNAPHLLLSHRGNAAIGFTTNELRIYRDAGMKVGFQYVSNTNYPTRFNTLVARSGDIDRLGSCLRELVPMLQRAQVSYVEAPDRALAMASELNVAYSAGDSSYSVAHGRFALEGLLRDGIIAQRNGVPFGATDPTSSVKMLNTMRSVYDSTPGSPTLPDIDPGDLATNEFLDRTVQLVR